VSARVRDDDGAGIGGSAEQWIEELTGAVSRRRVRLSCSLRVTIVRDRAENVSRDLPGDPHRDQRSDR